MIAKSIHSSLPNESKTDFNKCVNINNNNYYFYTIFPVH